MRCSLILSQYGSVRARLLGSLRPRRGPGIARPRAPGQGQRQGRGAGLRGQGGGTVQSDGTRRYKYSKFGALQVEQEYVNREELPIEAIYYFPVEEDAAVVGFHAELEGRYRTIRY